MIYEAATSIISTLKSNIFSFCGPSVAYAANTKYCMCKCVSLKRSWSTTQFESLMTPARETAINLSHKFDEIVIVMIIVPLCYGGSYGLFTSSIIS